MIGKLWRLENRVSKGCNGHYIVQISNIGNDYIDGAWVFNHYGDSRENCWYPNGCWDSSCIISLSKPTDDDIDLYRRKYDEYQVKHNISDSEEAIIE